MPKLLDTNVLIAGSAANPLSGLAGRASPLEPELREIVFKALTDFAASGDHIVLDFEGHIRSEYEANMGYNSELRDQEYGLLLLQEFEQTQRITFVTIEFDPVLVAAVLPQNLVPIVTDRADRKWVAAAISHSELYNNVFPPIVYAAEYDWYQIEGQLAAEGLVFERLLPDAWYQNRRQS